MFIELAQFANDTMMSTYAAGCIAFALKERDIIVIVVKVN